MYAIVDIKGKQFKVEKGQTLDIPKVADKVGSKIEFDKVLLTSNNGNISNSTFEFYNIFREKSNLVHAKNQQKISNYFFLRMRLE